MPNIWDTTIRVEYREPRRDTLCVQQSFSRDISKDPQALKYAFEKIFHQINSVVNYDKDCSN